MLHAPLVGEVPGSNYCVVGARYRRYFIEGVVHIGDYEEAHVLQTTSNKIFCDLESVRRRARKRWGSLDVELSPDSPANYPCLYVDAFSVAGALSDREELFRGLAESGLDATLVIDAWEEAHLPLARRYLELCAKWGLKCVLSERRPAEEYAVELACRDGCAVVTRDYDALRRALELNCNAPVLLFRGGRTYRARALGRS